MATRRDVVWPKAAGPLRRRTAGRADRLLPTGFVEKLVDGTSGAIQDVVRENVNLSSPVIATILANSRVCDSRNFYV
jgi:hypothetical protein